MAISPGNHLKKTQVAEEESDSVSDVESSMDTGLEPEDNVEDVKQELVEDNSIKEIKDEHDMNDMEDDSHTDDSSLVEIQEEAESDMNSEEIEDDDLKSRSEADQATNIAKKSLKTTRAMEDASGDSEEDSVSVDDDIDDYGDDSEAEVESDEDSNKESSSTGLANVMAKILATKHSDNVILSKAKKAKRVSEEAKDSDDDSFEIVDDSGKIKKESEIKEEEKESKIGESKHERELQKKILENRFLVKPNLKEDWAKEKQLKILATQGVVQLFSAIEKHRSMVQKKLSETRSMMGREKIMENTGKEAFLAVLREQGEKIKVPKEEESIKEEIKDELLDEPVMKKPRWNVLADNFYKEPTLQGWDQQSDED
ncbi:hypothetical protein OTU49_017259 [Cherax quadricarinatus]|uniref:RRP15-like protein n=2 Tax=Cherax quadricarinatus TaxID=27406 RepID=A0AAW0XNK0_CHEQU|nr:RRP15-like protein isoform X2 [Cherax quadricarinatus]XP_053633390.1 RRP15-like protein isoform X2 [Cherax quadricarinatus]XP_053633391.1 RRP15-like protein isoform X2 [Cherax quadricarinatus]XP_053633392.1 RRP15-like protein isoform X2 [Cherax quadricarinatus]